MAASSSLRQDAAFAPELFDERDEAAQLKLAAAMEQEAFDRAPYVPLGQIQQPTVYRKSVSDIVPASAPLFWNLRKG